MRPAVEQVRGRWTVLSGGRSLPRFWGLERPKFGRGEIEAAWSSKETSGTVRAAGIWVPYMSQVPRQCFATRRILV